MRYTICYPAHGDVVELVDTHALGACAARREGSSPFILTKEKRLTSVGLFSFLRYVKGLDEL
jgi:hypothetical protein